MEIQDLVPINWCNQRVLTTLQVADAYGTTPHRIRDNFKRSKQYFTEGEHYFKVSGEALRELKTSMSEVFFSDFQAPFSLRATNITLWTYQGCARHCKMLNTPQAWAMFNAMERFYFGVLKGEMPMLETPATPAPAIEDTEVIRLQKQLSALSTYDFAVVYVLLMSNGTVKIGMTKDLTDRVKQLKAETGLFVLNFATTPFLPRDDAAALEIALKEKFSAYSLGGEFFDVKFTLVAAAL